MRRVAGHFAIGLSTACALALLVLWARSWTRIEGYEWNDAKLDGKALTHRIFGARSSGGVAMLSATFTYDPASNHRGGWHSHGYYQFVESNRYPIDPFWKRRFGIARTSMFRGSTSYVVAAPHPVWAAIALLPGGVVIARRVRRHRRIRRGVCLGCGYDLRASPERCPECGRISESITAAQPMPTA